MRGERWLPAVAVGLFALMFALTLYAAGSGLGYDLNAYTHAAQRLLAGQPLYDPAVDVAGGFAIFLYPPPFALLVVPFLPITNAFGPIPWILLLVACQWAAIGLLPVRRETRWWIALLGALSWPVMYSLKLGQVGPVLFLLAAIGWRWRDRPGILGAAIALGTIVKVQPALLFGWAILTRRWRAVAVGLAVLVAASAVATVAAGGPSVWTDYLALLGRVNAPVTTPHNYTPGAVLYQLGVGQETATAIQWASTLAALVLTAWAAVRRGPEVGYLTAVTAGQLVSPVLWEHYTMLVLLPTAWLLDRGRWWAAAIPLASCVFVFAFIPPIVYPIALWAALLAPLAVSPGHRRADRELGLRGSAG